LREAAALAAGGALLASQQSVEHRPVNSVEDLLSSMAQDGMLPPGVSLDANKASLTSQNGLYYVRFRAEPVGVEVLSLGKGQGSGIPLLVRLPDDEFSPNALTYYIAPQTEVQGVPAAFSTSAQIINAGWRPEMFKAAAVSAEEGQKERAWLANEGAGRSR
jgi:hypothetical protein